MFTLSWPGLLKAFNQSFESAPGSQVQNNRGSLPACRSQVPLAFISLQLFLVLLLRDSEDLGALHGALGLFPVDPPLPPAILSLSSGCWHQLPTPFGLPSFIVSPDHLFFLCILAF